MRIRAALARFLSDFWEFLLTILIALAAIGLTVLGVAGLNTSQIVASATLLALATLTASALRERATIKSMARQLNSILSERTKLRAEAFFDQAGIDAHGEYKLDISKSKEVWILGISNLRTIRIYEADLRQALSGGARIKILMINPDPSNCALLMQATRHSYPGPETTLSHCLEACQMLEGIRSSGRQPSRLEIRGIDNYLPPVGMLLVNPKREDGKISVKLYPFGRAESEYPRFSLASDGDKIWYSFFLREFEGLWMKATPVIA